jgi:hypothetical protein
MVFYSDYYKQKALCTVRYYSNFFVIGENYKFLVSSTISLTSIYSVRWGQSKLQRPEFYFKLCQSFWDYYTNKKLANQGKYTTPVFALISVQNTIWNPLYC